MAAVNKTNKTAQQAKDGAASKTSQGGKPSPGKKDDQRTTEAQEIDTKKETSKAAKTAIAAQNKAKELTAAAAAAADPDERQKLLKQALDKEVEAESHGKAASWLDSGAIQGLVAGTGLGTGIGATLGTITGTLVGGTTSVVTGGLGAAVGTGVGALHGPFATVGDALSKGTGPLSKITNMIPGWKATDKQKAALEKMVNGVKEQDRPSEEDLARMSGSIDDDAKKTASKDKAGTGKASRPKTTSTGEPRKPPKKLEVRGEKAKS